MSDLFQNQAAKSGPVECLGQTFPSDAARREHYLKLLAEKLKDPEFRKVDGFPLGANEDILALSDPPYYTACPNPFIEDYVRHYGKPYDSSIPYSKEPFAADVSEGKNEPIYNAHSYHTKVPHKAIMRYILHYTHPGDIVFDGFCGTGMTGVAAQLCGNKAEVESLGYRVETDGTILEFQKDEIPAVWKSVSKLGARRVVLNDLSTAATFISYNYNSPVDIHLFEEEAKKILGEVEAKYGWMFETLHTDRKSKGKINYTVWSDVFTCPQCAGEVVYWDAAVNKTESTVSEEFSCPHCSVMLTKRSMEHAWISSIDKSIGQTIRQAKQVPVFINYSIGRKRYEKTPDTFDLDLIRKVDSLDIPYWFPTDRMIEGGETRRNDPIGITNVHHFYTKRNLTCLAFLLDCIEKYKCDHRFYNFLKIWFTSTHSRLHRMNRYAAQHNRHVGPLANTLYMSSTPAEISPIYFFGAKIKDNCVNLPTPRTAITSCGSAGAMLIPDASFDYIFLDPPFGANINYSELNFLWEAWLKVVTNNLPEAIQNSSQSKNLDDYRHLMTACFKEAYRLLKPGRWLTIEFSNTKASVWNAIQTALQEAGFVVSNVEALNKGRGGLHAIIGPTAVKQDLVISAYKPNGGLEKRFTQSGGSEDSAWDFVRTHLNYLSPVRTKNGGLEFISERDPRIIFDRMVAWFVRHNTPVPMSSQEFQSGLAQRFVDRDGMVFLSDQVGGYDKKRLQVAIAPQMEMFVSDERSAIDWLTDFLKRRPSTYQEISPEFIGQLGAGWKKHEAKPELSTLLEGNFLRYEGTGEVPSQIHSYLSTNHKDLRSLEKNSAALVAKAKDRWYVPDPNKAQDLEKKREKALLKEFEGYQAATGRKLKEFRLEVLRAGFKAAWGAKNYKAIIAIAQKIPEEVLQEDEKLLLWYDQALTRSEER